MAQYSGPPQLSQNWRILLEERRNDPPGRPFFYTEMTQITLHQLFFFFIELLTNCPPLFFLLGYSMFTCRILIFFPNISLDFLEIEHQKTAQSATELRTFEAPQSRFDIRVLSVPSRVHMGG